MPEGTKEYRTPYESAPPPPAGPLPVPMPKAEPPQIGRLRTDKILSEIRKQRVGSLKRSILVLFLIFSAAAVGIWWAKSPMLALGALVFFVSIFPLVALCARWHTIAAVSPALAFLLSVPFLKNMPVFTGIALIAIAASFLFAAALAMRAKSGNLVNFRISEIVRAGMRFLMIALATIYAGAYYYAVLPGRIAGEQFLFSRSALETVLNAGAAGIRIFLPNFRANMTVEEFADSFVESRKESIVEKLADEPAYKTLSESGREQLEKRVLADAKRGLLESWSQSAGRPITGRDTVGGILWESFSRGFRELAPETKRVTAIAFGSGVWVTLIIFGTLLTSLFGFFSWVLAEILLATGFFEISRELTERKTLSV